MLSVYQVEGLTTVCVRKHHLAPHGILLANSMILVVHMAIVIVTSNNVHIMLGVLDIVITCGWCQLQHPLGIRPVSRILMVDVAITCNNASAMLGINNVKCVLASST